MALYTSMQGCREEIKIIKVAFFGQFQIFSLQYSAGFANYFMELLNCTMMQFLFHYFVKVSLQLSIKSLLVVISVTFSARDLFN